MLTKIGQFMSNSKRNNFIKKFYKNCDLKTTSRSFCVCKELSTTCIGKWNFWSNPLNLSKSASWPTQIAFYRGFFQNYKGPGTSFQATILTEFIDKFFFLYCYIIWPNFINRLCLLPKLFNKMFRVSCLGIWWRHDVWISENLKFDYLKNENSFGSETKNIFPCSTSTLC